MALLCFCALDDKLHSDIIADSNNYKTFSLHGSTNINWEMSKPLKTNGFKISRIYQIQQKNKPWKYHLTLPVLQLQPPPGVK